MKAYIGANVKFQAYFDLMALRYNFFIFIRYCCLSAIIYPSCGAVQKLRVQHEWL